MIVPGIQLGIIEGGDDKDPSPNMDGAVRVRILSEMGPRVKTEHLAFSKPLYPPNQAQGAVNSPPLDKGSLVLALSTPTVNGAEGSNFTTIIGHIQSVADDNGNLPGSEQNPISKTITTLRSETKDVRLPPSIRETVRGGIKVREAVEKNQDFALKYYNGIPSHGAIYPLAGIPLPGINNIPTAKQNYGDILTPNIAALLPGSVMSLGKMFSLFSGTMLNGIFDSLPRELRGSLESLTFLIQNFESNEMGTFSTAGKVNEDVFMSNAVKVLSGQSNLYGLTNSMMRLQMDTTLHGLDKLDPVSLAVGAVFGQVNKQYDAYGNVLETVLPDAVALLVQAFGGILSNATSLPGADGSSSLFGDTSDTVDQCMARVPMEVEQSRRQLVSNLAELPESTRVNSYMKKFINGGTAIG